MTIDELLEALAAHDYDSLVGVREDGTVDFKGAPYPLSTEAGKYELAKDVASFASGQQLPAAIVLPVETEASEDSPFERVSRVRPIDRDRIDEKQIQDVIRSHVYPTVRGLDVRVLTNPDATKCVVAIVVPAQREGDKPFLVLSPLGASGAKVQGWLVGLPLRAVDQTEQMRPEELHELIARGRGVATRVEEIAAMLAHGRTQAGEEAADLAQETERRARAAADAFVGSYDAYGTRLMPPTLVLAATLTAPASVPSLLRSDGVRQVLEHPPHTRHEGWNLATLNRAELVEGTRLEVASGQRKFLSLSEDGSFLFVAPLLAHRAHPMGTSESGRPAFKLNSLALVEFTHDFVLTYQAIAQHIEPEPQEAYFLIGVLSATGGIEGDVVLPKYGVDSIEWVTAALGSKVQLPDARDHVWGTVQPLKRTAGAIAYVLLERVYGFFKHTNDVIPYVNGERTAVDPESFFRKS